MVISDMEFTTVVPTNTIMKAIKISGYNMKTVYNYLNEVGCENIPNERSQAGNIWVYDPDSNECVTMSEEEFNTLFTDKLEV